MSDANYRQGAEAFRRGEPISNCIRVTSKLAMRQWRKGWLHAHGYDHAFDPGPYGVCRKCGEERHPNP